VTTLALTLLALAAAAPLSTRPVGRVVTDPVVPVAGLTALLLATAVAVAAAADPTAGWREAAALALGVVVAVTGGSLVVRAVFRLMRREFLPARTRLGAAQTPAVDDAASELDVPPADRERPEAVLRGGAWIGYLERAAVAATLLAGWPEGVALVLAVKGVGRYPELREANAPETFIVGTLASLLWAASAAGAAQLLR
jgi:hypothetical protein